MVSTFEMSLFITLVKIRATTESPDLVIPNKNCDFKHQLSKRHFVCVKITLLIMLEKFPAMHTKEKKKVLTSASMNSFQNLPELGNCVTSRSYVFLALSMGWF